MPRSMQPNSSAWPLNGACRCRYSDAPATTRAHSGIGGSSTRNRDCRRPGKFSNEPAMSGFRCTWRKPSWTPSRKRSWMPRGLLHRRSLRRVGKKHPDPARNESRHDRSASSRKKDIEGPTHSGRNCRPPYLLGHRDAPGKLFANRLRFPSSRRLARMKHIRTAALVCLAFALAACGGGGHLSVETPGGGEKHETHILEFTPGEPS